jgi:hypothetical protein
VLVNSTGSHRQHRLGNCTASSTASIQGCCNCPGHSMAFCSTTSQSTTCCSAALHLTTTHNTASHCTTTHSMWPVAVPPHSARPVAALHHTTTLSTHSTQTLKCTAPHCTACCAFTSHRAACCRRACADGGSGHGCGALVVLCSCA